MRKLQQMLEEIRELQHVQDMSSRSRKMLEDILAAEEAHKAFEIYKNDRIRNELGMNKVTSTLFVERCAVCGAKGLIPQCSYCKATNIAAPPTSMQTGRATSGGCGCCVRILCGRRRPGVV